MSRQRATHIVVLGNEKGGAGKTTTAMHVIVGLLRMGFAVGTIDLDSRQRSLSRYIENRGRWMLRAHVELAMPDHRVVEKSGQDSLAAAMSEERQSLAETIADLSQTNDFIVIDCPGSDVPLARFAHACADTLITPMNDSLVDLDLLGELEPEGMALRAAGVYATMVWEQRRMRMKTVRSGTDWLVLRTRLSATADRNKATIADSLDKMSRVLGFRVGQGFGERVIYRYLFLVGLTVLDLQESGVEMKLTKSHQAARDEVVGLLDALWIPRLEGLTQRI